MSVRFYMCVSVCACVIFSKYLYMWYVSWTWLYFFKFYSYVVLCLRQWMFVNISACVCLCVCVCTIRISYLSLVVVSACFILTLDNLITHLYMNLYKSMLMTIMMCACDILLICCWFRFVVRCILCFIFNFKINGRQ